MKIYSTKRQALHRKLAFLSISKLRALASQNTIQIPKKANKEQILNILSRLL